MAATPSVKVEKEFSYRGSVKTFSNRYHFNGGVPADNTHWNTLFDAIVAAEKLVYKNDVQIVRCIGYLAGSDLPVHDKVYTQLGTASMGLWVDTPGDCAAVVRYATTARSAKNHPIYLFNYYHGIGSDASGGVDVLSTEQKALLETYASSWITGFSDGAITAVRAGPNGATATSRLVLPEVRHRDFPNR